MCDLGQVERPRALSDLPQTDILVDRLSQSEESLRLSNHAGETTVTGQRAQIPVAVRGPSSTHVGDRFHRPHYPGSEFGGGSAVRPYAGAVSWHEPGSGAGKRSERHAVGRPAPRAEERRATK